MQRDGDATDFSAIKLNGTAALLRSTNSLCFNCARRHCYVSGKGITRASVEIQLQLYPE